MKRHRVLFFLFVLLATCLVYGFIHSYMNDSYLKNHRPLPRASDKTFPGDSQILLHDSSQQINPVASHLSHPRNSQWSISGIGNTLKNTVQVNRTNLAKKQYDNFISKRDIILNRRMKWKDIAERRPSYIENRMGKAHRIFEFPTKEKTGYFDFQKMEPIQFLPDFKGPCWNGTADNGPIHDNNIHCVPYFYIIGIMKCGTSDLFKRLLQHPDIVYPGFKEAQWFGHTRQQPWNTRGDGDPRQLSHYVLRYKEATTKVLRHPTPTSNGTTYFGQVFADASPSTIFRNDGWWRLPGNDNVTEPRYTNLDCIHKLFPGAKIIVIFRDPVARLYSDYLFRFRYVPRVRPSRYEFHSNVVKATNQFHACLQKRSLRACVYDDSSRINERRFKFRLELGLYSFYMSEVYLVFRRENVHIVLLPDYHEHMTEALQKVFGFLGLRSLDQTEIQPILTLGVQNSKSDIKQRAGLMLNETEQILRRFYTPYNEEMAKLMGDSRYLFAHS